MDIINFPEKELWLRPITSASVANVKALMQSCYSPVYQHLWEDGGQWYLDTTFSESAVLLDLQESDSPYWIIEWRGQPAGILRLNLYKACPNLTKEVKALKLHRIYLHPRTHRQGIGRTLMEFILKYAQQLDREVVWLEAMDTQTDALKFYEKMGFETKGAFRLDFDRMHSQLRGMVRMVAAV